MAKWKQMKMIVGSIMVGALLMPTMSITAWANAETEVTVDNFESEILPNLAIKEDGTPLKVAITVAELDSEYVIAVQKYAQYLLETAGAEVTVSSADGDVENQCNQIYDFIEKGVDVVLIQAADSNAVAPAVKACNEAGVTAIAVGRAINGDCTVDYSALIDDVAMGKLAAEYVADNAGEGATVTTMQGTLGTASADDRTTGFAEGVEEYGLDDASDAAEPAKQFGQHPPAVEVESVVVAVLGSGEYALHEVQALLPVVKSVTLLTNGAALTADFPPEVSVCTQKVEAILGEQAVTGVQLADGAVRAVSGVFVALGVAGSTALARKLGAAVEGSRIVVDDKMQTTVPGLYAAGDCTGGLLQVAKAVYEGALAGTEAAKALRKG